MSSTADGRCVRVGAGENGFSHFVSNGESPTADVNDSTGLTIHLGCYAALTIFPVVIEGSNS